MQNQQKTNLNPSNQLYDEATRVALLTKAGGMITRSLVIQGEEMLKNSNTPGRK